MEYYYRYHPNIHGKEPHDEDIMYWMIKAMRKELMTPYGTIDPAFLEKWNADWLQLTSNYGK